jgi:hypothetical protein
MGIRIADLMAGSSEGPPIIKSAGKKGEPFCLDGLKPGDVWRLHKRSYAFVERYDYHDESGSTLFAKLRFVGTDGGGKTFIQVSPVDERRWAFGVTSRGVREVPYNLPAVRRAVAAGGTIYVAEGEKDCDAIGRLGLTATCNAGGAGKWRSEHTEALKGAARVIIIADKDLGELEAKQDNPEAREWWQGQRHATDVLAALAAAGIPCNALTLPDVDGFRVKDFSDWVALVRGVGAADQESAISAREALAARRSSCRTRRSPGGSAFRAPFFF